MRSKVSYDALAVEGLKTILAQVSSACLSLNIDFFLVGAIARNIWYVSHGEQARGTKDIDFGIYVSDQQSYNKLRTTLRIQYGYEFSRENDFCLISPDGKNIDLLPFGEIEKEGQLMIEGKGLASVKLDGFQESYELGLAKAQIGKEVYQVCSVPGIVILKLIAFDDRPERRTKDVVDLNAICKYYPDIESESIWEDHYDLYENKTHQEVAMIALGREMNKIAGVNKALKDRLIAIIKKALNQQSNLLLHMIEDPEKETIAEKANLLRHMLTGLA